MFRARFKKVTFGLSLMALFLATPLRAQNENCGFEPLILQAADRILEIRPDSRPLVSHRGTDAVYFKIIYGGLPAEEGLALITQVRNELRHSPHQIDDLEQAYKIALLGAKAALATMAPTPVEAFSELSVAGLPAVILEDGGALFLRFTEKCLRTSI